jgi:hypothetical protein
MMVPRMVASVTSGFHSSSIFFTDSTKGGAGSGFGVYHSDGLKSNIRLRKPGGVFSSKMLVTFVVLIQIKARNPGMMGMKFTCCIIIFLV